MIGACEAAIVFATVIGRPPDTAALEWEQTAATVEQAYTQTFQAPEVFGWYGDLWPNWIPHLSNETRDECGTAATTVDLRALARDIANHHGIDPDRFARIIECESSWDPNARNPHSSAAGLAQFLDGTWAWISDIGAPYPNGDRTNPTHALHNAAWLMSRSDLGGFNHWVCR